MTNYNKSPFERKLEKVQRFVLISGVLFFALIIVRLIFGF